MIVQKKTISKQSLKLLSHLRSFLLSKQAGGASLLLGVSGGNDSLALLRSALLLREELDLQLYLLHCDHRWREESGEQAALLASWAEELDIPFLLAEEKPIKKTEEEARSFRLFAFKEMQKKYACRALLLAHHCGDQEESVAKSIFEGAPLWKLAGMADEERMDSLIIWRPFLKLPKKLLRASIEGFYPVLEDTTEGDLRYTRNRLRHQILPQLSKDFGKNIAPSLCRISQESRFLHEHLSKLSSPFLDGIKEGVLGKYLDLSSFELDALTLLYILKAFCFPLPLSREAAHQALVFVQERSANRLLSCSDHILGIDRARIFLWKKERAFPSHRFEKNFAPLSSQKGWESLFEEQVSFPLPKGKYKVLGKDELDRDQWVSLRKLWIQKKVPAFLWPFIPILFHEGSFYADCALGFQQKERGLIFQSLFLQ